MKNYSCLSFLNCLLKTRKKLIFFTIIISVAFLGLPIRAQTVQGDLNNDGKIDVQDLGIFLANWGNTTRPASDFNQSGLVDVVDLGILLGNWGKTVQSGETYTVPLTTNVVDGDTFCGGNPCSSSDKIIIQGGTRAGLTFKDFNGNGNYITVTNDPVNRVILDGNLGAGIGVLTIDNCRYVNFTMNNNPTYTYGVKVINGPTNQRSGAIKTYFPDSFVKIGYFEVTQGDLDENSTGIQINHNYYDNTYTVSDYEIHHNYIHDVGYCAMYLGMNDAPVRDDFWIKNFIVHDNLIEDIGCYGVGFKSTKEGTHEFYNNIIKRTGRHPENLEGTPANWGDWLSGLRIRYFQAPTQGMDIHDNWIEDTLGPAVHIGAYGNHQIRDNILLKNGIASSEPLIVGTYSRYGQAVLLNGLSNAGNCNVYDNIIVQPYRYAIYADSTGNIMSRNIICDGDYGDTGDGGGEYSTTPGGSITEDTGINANIYQSDCSDIGFAAWSDDGDYSNDDFRLGVTVESCFDGVQNQDETGVDCGGVCAPCITVDVYYVPNSVTTVDGDTFCDGKCTADDTIIIEGGTRPTSKRFWRSNRNIFFIYGMGSNWYIFSRGIIGRDIQLGS